MLKRLRLAFAVALAGGVLVPSSAAAFCRSTTCSGTCAHDKNGCKTTGAKLYWPGVCVGFSLQRDGTVNIPMDKVRPVIERSFATWSSVDCGGGAFASIAFAELDDVSCRVPDYDASKPNANVVAFQDTKWIYTGVDNTLAKTTVTYDTDTGEIEDADIEINHAYNEFTVTDDNVVYDLQSVVTHEIGHFIGLDHSPERDATMFAGYDVGTTGLRTLSADDIAGLCAAYPPSRTGKCDPTPRNGLGDKCTAEEGDGPGGGGAQIGCAMGARGPARSDAPGALAALSIGAIGLVCRARRRGVG